MKVKTERNSTIIKDSQEDIATFLDKITAQYTSFAAQNLILDLSKKTDTTASDVLLFVDISTKHKKNGKSFIIVMNESFDFNEATDKVMLVPTLQEAHDIIELEEIERDLGF
jgi:hypothetical protein